MSEPVPAAPSPPATPSCPEAVFRTITPIFKYRLDGATHFTHSGKRRDADFRIELRPYTVNLKDFGEITRYATEAVRQMLRDRAIHRSDHFFSDAAHILIVDVDYAAGIIPDYEGTTEASQELLLAALEALRLHSSSGLTYHETYYFRSNPSVHGGLGIGAANVLQGRFSHLPSPSILRASQLDACRATIDTFLSRKWSDKSTFDNVLQLAKEYHRTSFNLEHVTHAFLILMVVFEALFKKKDEKNAGKAAQRIGRLLGVTKKGCTAIGREFFDGAVDSFGTVRNQVAHGDTSLDGRQVSSKYPGLYRHISETIIRLLALPPGEVDNGKDYYDEITRIVNARFAGLPTK